MEYLNRVLGIRTSYYDQEPKELPNYIYSTYRLRRVNINGIEAVFAYPKDMLDPISTIKTQFHRITEKYQIPVVLVADKLTYREREYLLSYHIPFVVDGKQIYLPFMGMYLQRRSDGDKQIIKSVLPSAQLLLLYFIYQGCGELLTSRVGSKLDLSAMSVSRAARQLKDLDLIDMEKDGVNMIMRTEKTPQELFSAAKNLLPNPVKRKIYVSKKNIDEDLLESGISALSEYTMISSSSVICYASDTIRRWEKDSAKRIHDIDDQCEIELWRYDPKKLTDGKYVDRLSLALSFKDDDDERIEMAVDEMLEQLWREIDGKRN